MVIHDRRDWFGRYLDEFAVGDIVDEVTGERDDE